MQWLRLAVVLVASVICAASDLEQDLRTLSKQVSTLLDRRRDDLRLIEDSLRRKLIGSREILDVKEELQNLRVEIEQLRSGNVHKVHHSQHVGTQEKNDHLTVKWLSTSMTELKIEVQELQNSLNTSTVLENREVVEGELTLLKTDVINLSRELEATKNQNVRYEAELSAAKEELNSLRDSNRATAVSCGKTKNQLKAAQLEWNFNWKNLIERKTVVPLQEEGQTSDQHPSRHRRIMKKHILDLERTTKHLRHTNEELQRKVLKLEEEIQIVQNSMKTQNEASYDRISGNEIENFVKNHKINEISPILSEQQTYDEKFIRLEEQQIENTNTLYNLTLQLSNFDKLHMSMLELLENVESIENKVDKTLPDFRKEISKLELQMSETTSKMALIKEDQTNTRESMKAIAVSVSNIKDKMESDQRIFKDLSGHVENLKKSSTVQTSKLHDHILKTESMPVNSNMTKSAIYLVEELKNFEQEYKSIINKLPHDCSSVSGPNGLYLISPGDDGEPLMALCEDGWTTIQKREDGSVNFNRNWNDYSNGFGSASGEYWIGNRNLHSLTKDNCTKLQINMRDIYGKYWQATYERFFVANFDKGFKLSVAGYSGNASDALDYQNHMEFSTIDNDRDISNTHCASNYEGGWWFSHCQHANLNGRYNLGLTWFDSARNEWIAVATSVMKTKKKDAC